ncbi:hypothetical protein GP5015_1481 [gamma proteobacterium HTCC5015]|nr:hypothetical protein GP5015_1481 [gamma proteobacterium HTCC5015]
MIRFSSWLAALKAFDMVSHEFIVVTRVYPSHLQKKAQHHQRD